jgi:hypothetical protein
MSQYDTALFLLILALYFPAFGLYHLMVYRVNREQPPDRRIPHSLFWGHWSRLRTAYNSFYPRSIVYQLTLSSAVSVLILALALLALRFLGI